MPGKPPDGAPIRKKKRVSSFQMDQWAVTNAQFDCFVQETNYVTETEVYGWSFVFEGLASPDTIAEADDKENGMFFSLHIR